MGFFGDFVKGIGNVGKLAAGLVTGGNSSAVGSLVSNGIGSLFANDSRGRQTDQAKDLMNYQNNLSLSNLYQSPQLQMQGIKAAGLSGATLNGQFGNVAQSPVPTMGQAYNPQLGDLSQNMLQQQQFKNNSLDLDMKEELLRGEQLKNDNQEVENKYQEAFKELDLAKLNSVIRQIDAEVDLTNEQKRSVQKQTRLLADTYDDLLEKARLENINLGSVIRKLDTESKVMIEQLPLQLKKYAAEVAMLYSQGKLNIAQAQQCIANVGMLTEMAGYYGQLTSNSKVQNHMMQNELFTQEQTLTVKIAADKAKNNYDSDYYSKRIDNIPILTKSEQAELNYNYEQFKSKHHTDAWNFTINSINQLAEPLGSMAGAAIGTGAAAKVVSKLK